MTIKRLLRWSVITCALGGLLACSPLRIINAVTPSSSYDRKADIAFGADARQRLDVYMPRSVIGKAPIVVFFYGGSWNTGDKNDYVFVGEALAASGIVVVIADYRLYPQVRYPGFVEDGAMAVAWAYAHAADIGGDPQRLFVMGHSAGAYNAAMLALDPRWLAKVDMTPSMLCGWIGLAGPYDFLPIENPDVKPVFFYPDTPPDSQPIRHVSPAAPATLLMAARDDVLVDPQRNTVALSGRLRAAGVPVKERLFDRVSHATLIGAMAWPLRSLAPVRDEVVTFVREPTASVHLGQSPPR